MSRGILSPLVRILSQFKEYYGIVVIYSICISVLTLATPISVQSLVNTFSFGPYFQPIFVLSAILFGLLALLGVVKSLQYLIVEYLQRKLYGKVTASIVQAYLLDSKDSHGRIEDKANRYFDVILIHKNLAYLVTDGVAMVLQTVFGLILVALYHPYFMVFGVVILLAILAPLYLLGLRGLHSSVEESTAKFYVADHLKSLAGGMSKGGSAEQKVDEANGAINTFLTKRAAHFRTVFIQNIFYVGLYAFLNALLLALGGYLVIKNQLSVGQLVAAEIVVNAILSHFLYAKKYLETFYDIFAASKKLEIFYHFIDAHAKGVDTQDFQSKLPAVNAIYAPQSYRRTFRRFAMSIFAVIAILLVTPWQQFSRGVGKVLAYNPNDRIQKITAPLSGVVEEWLVQEGQVVQKGDPIVRVVDNDPNYLVRLEAQRDAAVAKFEAAKEASDTGRLNFHRQEALVKQGLSSQKEFEQAKIKYKKLRSDEASAAAGLAKAETDVSRQEQQVILASRDGQILRILLGSGTTNVKAGEALVDFVPKTNQKAVELFLDGNDLPLVFEGRKVRLQFEGWPAVQFTGWPSVAIGSFGGVVGSIDPSVSAEGTFRVLVQPDPEEDVDWPDDSVLRQGARTMGIVILDQVSVGYEIWRQVNGFPKSMPQDPALQKTGKKGSR